MLNTDREKISEILEELVTTNSSAEFCGWLKQTLQKSSVSPALNQLFTSLPRKTGKKPITVTSDQASKLNALYPGFSVSGYTIDRLARVFLLIKIDHAKPETYFQSIESLFAGAEMNELVALYSSLGLLSFPDMWKVRCAEGIRSNLGSVLEAIMYHNPYPEQNLDQHAWNQMVLKAFFTDKDVNKISGLDRRSNEELAYILSDYAHERWAAGRSVNPQLWRLTAPFLDEVLFEDVKRLFQSNSDSDRKTAAVIAFQSGYHPALELIQTEPKLALAVQNEQITWKILEEEHQV